VRSNDGTLLYEGTVRETVEADGFRVEVPLQAVDGVLKACPDPILLTDSNDYTGELAVINRGAEPVAWTATTPPLCDGAPCLDLIPSAATTAPGDTTALTGTFNFTTDERTFGVRISSGVGTLDVVFEVEDG